MSAGAPCGTPSLLEVLGPVVAEQVSYMRETRVPLIHAADAMGMAWSRYLTWDCVAIEMARWHAKHVNSLRGSIEE